MNYDDVIKLHVEKFGVKPIFNGRTWALDEVDILILILEAIDRGEPYKEEALTDTQSA